MGAKIEEITEKLNAASKEEDVETSPVETEETEETEEEVETPKSKSNGKTAQDRIKALVNEKKALEAELDKVNGRLSEKDNEVAKLIDAVKARTKDSLIIDRINELHKDPRFTAKIDELDELVRATEDQLEALESKSKPASKDDSETVNKLKTDLDRKLEAQKAELEDHKSDLLLEKTERVLDRAFAEFTEDYNEGDIKVLRNVLSDMVDWEAIEADPSTLEAAVLDGLQKAVTWYGDPKGKLASKSKQADNSDEEKPEKKTEVDLSKIDFGKMKEETIGKKTVKSAVISDDEFAAVMAEQMKRANRK